MGPGDDRRKEVFVLSAKSWLSTAETYTTTTTTTTTADTMTTPTHRNPRTRAYPSPVHTDHPLALYDGVDGVLEHPRRVGIPAGGVEGEVEVDGDGGHGGCGRVVSNQAGRTRWRLTSGGEVSCEPVRRTWCPVLPSEKPCGILDPPGEC